MKKLSTLFLLSLAALLLLFTTSTALAAESRWSVAPVGEIVRSGGVVSSPADTFHSGSRNRMAATYPAEFKVANLTPVRDQGYYGTCWAHAAMASSESLIKAKGLSSKPDLSEWQLATFAYKSQNGRPAFDVYNNPYDDGGNDDQATAMLARGTSPVRESTVPYGASTVSPNHKPAFTIKSTSIGHTPEEWKQLLMTKGALSISYYHDEYYVFQGSSGSTYYYYYDNYSPNHAVTLIGWDDNYTSPYLTGLRGAWLVKNSYGTWWGDDGYFWMFYDSGSIDPDATCYEYIAAQNENTYTWADLGMINTAGNGSDTGWMKTVFTATGHELLTAVGTYAVGDNTSYSISVTTRDSGGVYRPAFTTPQTGKIAMAGYQRIELKTPVRLAPKQKYEVIIRYTVPGSFYPMPIEYALDGYSSYARYAAGQTYYSADGVYWDDAYYNYYDSDGAIYAFTDNSVPPVPHIISAASNNNAYGNVTGAGTYIGGNTATLKATPYKGYYFAGWTEGGTTVSRDASYSFIVDKPRTLTAVFAKIAAPVVTAKSGGYNSVLLTWKAVPGATQYQVYRATTKTGTYSWVANTTATTYRNKSLTTGKTYYYKVRVKSIATTASTYGSYSYPKSAKPMPAAPKATAASAGYTSVKVSWGTVYGTTKYQVYRATSKTGTYKWLANTTATSYTNKSLTTGKTYYYKVRSYREVGGKKHYGPYSAVVSAKPVPAAPTLTATRVSSSSIKLSWSKVSGRTMYQVYRATSKTGTYSKVAETTATNYTNKSLTRGKTYYYKVRAYRTVSGKKVYGTYSSVKSAKP